MEFTTKNQTIQMASFDETGSIKNLKELKVGNGERAWINNEGHFLFGDTTNNQYIKYDGETLNVRGTFAVGDIDGLGDLATLDAVGTGQLNTTIISGGKIVTGLLTASNIQTGTLTGINIISSSGNNSIRMTNGDILEFFYGGSRQGYIRSESSGNLRISTENNVDFRCDGTVRVSVVSAGIMPASDYGQDLGRKGSPNDRRWNKIYGQTFYGGSGAKSGKTTSGYGFINGLRKNDGNLEVRYAEIEVAGGIVTDFNEGSYYVVSSWP